MADEMIVMLFKTMMQHIIQKCDLYSVKYTVCNYHIIRMYKSVEIINRDHLSLYL